jgi:hypothetical protein
MTLTGILMGFRLLLLIHTPWGKRSGAHMNPTTKLMFLRIAVSGLVEEAACSSRQGT